MLTWLRLEVRRRWVSLVVLALLVAVSTATVLTATAGARRGDTALDRLEAQTLPSTVAVLANQPGFNWNKIKALPEVAAMTRFPVTFSFVVDGCPDASTDFPMMDASYRQYARKFGSMSPKGDCTAIGSLAASWHAEGHGRLHLFSSPQPTGVLVRKTRPPDGLRGPRDA